MMPTPQRERYAPVSVNGKGKNHKGEDEEIKRGASVDRRTRAHGIEFCISKRKQRPYGAEPMVPPKHWKSADAVPWRSSRKG